MSESTEKTPVKDRLARPLRDLRISVTDRCNLRCAYCMPAEEEYSFLPRRALLRFEEVARIAAASVRLGVEKIRITGGEPLLRKDLPHLIEQLREIEGLRDLALTTNGILLRAQARTLRDAGLDRVTVSLDSLDDETFGAINGRGVRVAPVLDGIEAALEAGLAPVKVNMMVQRGVNDGDVVSLAERFRGTGVIMRFIEYMDVGNRNDWTPDAVLPAAEIVQRIHERFPLQPLDAHYRGEVAARHAYADGQGEIGVIASVSQPFCGGCTRLRLSAEGKLYTCLFAQDGTNIRGALRNGVSDDTLVKIIEEIWLKRDDRYSELRGKTAGNGKRVEMFHIGG